MIESKFNQLVLYYASDIYFFISTTLKKIHERSKVISLIVLEWLWNQLADGEFQLISRIFVSRFDWGLYRMNYGWRAGEL